ncbi:MAG: nucleoside triphosphate pyrophosphohydrolase [Armatimonadota bacterium]|nr:nucleoside triphosphate pyrophosphohydrolase [bacterium]MCS7309925.1 nucleoside triphosphate pyrophosphohydrolase [Armatimonadota bacterium]MDW8291057.1 nucleoside triphosphate pyrophosphohydrolase [Armatimonadota bacterium]
MISVVGLGSGDPAALSPRAWEALRSGRPVWLRTAVHPTVQALREAGIPFQSFDPLYEQAESFEALYAQIVERLLEMAQEGDLVYAVPGHPLIGEESVRLLLQQARERGVPVQVVGSTGFLEPTLEALGLCITDGIQVIDALSASRFPPDQWMPVLYYQVHDQFVASDLKLWLMRYYPDEHPVRVVQAAGVEGEQRVHAVPLRELDRVPVDHLTSVYVPPLPPDERRDFAGLVHIVARLRGPGGCPWDREQTHETLRPFLLEEAYEVLDAINTGDDAKLCEELGDVLLQVVLHAQLASEAGRFDIQDVVSQQCDKLVRRHPHVFGDLQVADSAEVLRNWERIKAEENSHLPKQSVMEGVIPSLPALVFALEVSKRAVKVGFEWPDLQGVLDKFREEQQELAEAIAQGDRERVEAEIGDLLFTLVNIARHLKVDAEQALHAMVRRFIVRFQQMEAMAREQGKPLEHLTLEEWDALWEQAKRRIQQSE